MDLESIITLYHPEGKRSHVGVDENYLLANVDLKKDLLTTPKDLLRQFISPKSLPDFEKMDFDFEFTSSTTNEDLSEFMIKSINRLSGISGFEFDRRVQNISTKSIRGQGFFFEQYSLPLISLSDAQFQEVYKNFVEEAKLNNPAYLSFVSKSDINKTIIFTTNTKVISSSSINSPLQVSYSQRGHGFADFSSLVTSKSGNPVYTHIARSLFKAVERTNSNLVIDRGSNQTTILKSTFFKQSELTQEDIEKEKELRKIFKVINDVDEFDNNKNRGSMSPNTSKKYIDKKGADGDLLDIQKEGINNIKEIINPSKVEKTEEIKDEIKEVKPDLEIADKQKEVVEEKEVIAPIIEEEINKELNEPSITPEKEQEVKDEIKEVKPTPNENLLDQVLNELEIMTSREFLTMEQAFERKKIEAKELSYKMLEDFKNNIKMGGTLQSNLEKMHQTYRDNEFAVSLFGVLVKTELLKSVAKDEIINKLNSDVLGLNNKLESVKNNYENLISNHTSKIKSLEEQIISVTNEKEEIDEEFDEYVKGATSSLGDLRKELEEANVKLADYEEMKSVSEERNLYIEKLEKKSNILEKELLSVQGQLNGFETLKNLSELQGKSLSTLEKENDSLKNQLDLQNNSIKDLEKTLENIRQINIKLEEKLHQYETKIDITDNIKKELRDTNKIQREIGKKEEILIKNEKEINYLKPISEDDIANKILTAKEYSPEWHRLHLLKTKGINLQSEAWKKIDEKNHELYKQVVETINDLTKAELMYKMADGTYKFKEKAKNIIFENLSMTNEQLKEEFKKNTYQKSETGEGNNYSENKSYSKLRLKN